LAPVEGITTFRSYTYWTKWVSTGARRLTM